MVCVRGNAGEEEKTHYKNTLKRRCLLCQDLMEQDHGDKAPERAGDVAFASREQELPLMVVITPGDFPIGTIALRDILMPLDLE